MPDPNTTANVFCAGQVITNFESITVHREIKSGISTFSFSPTENNYRSGFTGLQIQPGDEVGIVLAGQRALRGWVTTRAGAFDANSHQLTIQGESKTRDAAHASVPIKPGTYDGFSLEQAARATLAPHGIALTMASPPPGADQPFQHLVPQYGETVGEFIGRLARMRNCFVTDDVNGGLVVGQLDPGCATSAALVEGGNILSASFRLEDPAAHLWNNLKGVSQTPGSDDNYPPRAFAATATTDAIRGNLQRVFIADHPSNSQELVTAVRHEAMDATWPVTEVQITVAGWLRPDGKLWATAPDASPYVTLFSPMVFPGQTAALVLGIAAIDFQQTSQNGTTTVLTLRRPGALTATPSRDLVDPGQPSLQRSVYPDAPDTQQQTAA